MDKWLLTLNYRKEFHTKTIFKEYNFTTRQRSQPGPVFQFWRPRPFNSENVFSPSVLLIIKKNVKISAYLLYSLSQQIPPPWR